MCRGCLSDIKATLLDHYNLVREFHIKFGHPFKHEMFKGTTPLAFQRWKLRSQWITDELEELLEAYNKKDVIGMIDALIDIQYFALGSIVEQTADVPASQDKPNADYTFQFFLHESNDDYWDWVYKYNLFVHGQLFTGSTVCYGIIYVCTKHVILRLLKDVFEIIPERIQETYEQIFNAVHQANMDKLFEDGKPRYKIDGKVAKPEGWVGPEERIKSILKK